MTPASPLEESITWRPAKQRAERPTALRALIEPSACAARDEGRRARLVLVLSLVQAAVCAVGAVETVVFTPAGHARVIFAVLAVRAALYTTAWAPARRGRVTSAAWATVAVQLVMPGAIVMGIGGDVNPMSTAAWSVFAGLTANALLGPRVVLVVGAVAGMLAVTTLTAVGSAIGPLCEAALFVACSSAVLHAYARFRDTLEVDRAATLRARNRELETMRAQLESRVTARTLEVARTADELRETSGQLSASRGALRNSEQMASVGRMSAGFAHELATPLGAIMASLSAAQSLLTEQEQSFDDPRVSVADQRAISVELRGTLDLIGRATTRASRFLRGMRTQIHQPAGERTEAFDACEVARQAAELVAYQAREAGVALVLDLPEGDALRTSGAPSRVQQALTNLLQNAIDALSARRAGRVELRARRAAAGIVLSVADDGPGIPESVLPRSFEPMFTTKPCGKRTGIGLAIVREVVDELGATIAVDTRLGAGTTFRIALPVQPLSAAA